MSTGQTVTVISRGSDERRRRRGHLPCRRHRGDRDVPLPPIRQVVGSLLLVFGLQWLRKGVLRVAAQGWAVGQGEEDVDDSDLPAGRFDRTGFVLSFKGARISAPGVAAVRRRPAVRLRRVLGRPGRRCQPAGW
jgi:hypothetical protein